MHTDVEIHQQGYDYLDKYIVSKKTARYWELKKKFKALPDNPFERIKYEQRNPPRRGANGVDYMLKPSLATAYAAGYALVPFGAPNGVDRRKLCEDMCRNKLLDAVREYPINLGVSLAEYRETADFAASCITSVAKSYRAMKKLQFRQAMRELGIHNPKKEWANKWLQWKYAVKPTLADCYGALEAYESRRFDLRGHSHEVKASKTIRFQHHDQWDLTGPSVSPTVRRSGDATIVGKVRCHGVLRFRVDDPLMFRMDQLGITNPALLVWEKIPYSFVLDWFIPVGNLLTNITLPKGATFLGGTLSTYIKGGAGGSERWNTESTLAGMTLSGSNWCEYYKRQKLSSFPKFTFIVPDLRLTVNKLVTAMALLTQVRSGH